AKAKIEIAVQKNSLGGGPSDEKTKESMAKMAAQAQGVKVTAMFDEQGTPSDVKYSGAASGSQPMLKAQASNAGIDMDTGFFGISYPKNAVKPGDTWTHSFDFSDSIPKMPMMGKAKWSNQIVTTKFTLKSVDNATGTAYIAIKIDASPSMNVKV